MKSYKDPSFQDRLGRAAASKQKALDSLRARPPVDQTVAAERREARLKREAADAERRAAKQVAEKAASDLKAAALAVTLAASPAPMTDAERKLARDARYAARKNRK